MKKVALGSSDLEVSEICLGTMTWGDQNSQEDANEQIHYALEQGINFIDTAELYAVPPNENTYGATEEIIGNWLAENPNKRSEIIIASKAAGPGFPWIRDASPLTGSNLTKALDQSLARLKTDYLDLYQIHWPNRPAPHFGNHWPQGVDYQDQNTEQILDTVRDLLEAIDRAVKAGKIRYPGLSNETPWGIQQYLSVAKEFDLPRMVSVQNEFNLLHLKDSPYLMETCSREKVGYLAWSPLAAGALSGKYIDGARPTGSRWTMEQRHGLFRDTAASNAAIKSYLSIANKHRLSLSQLSLAWMYQYNDVTSTIIGATSLDQLKENIDAYELDVSDELFSDINGVIRQYPVPF